MQKNDLQTVPFLGPKSEAMLRRIGIKAVEDLVDQDPEWMYDSLCRKEGKKVDRCVLYAFRCFVYYAGNERHDAELVKWWNWTDARMEARASGKG